MYNNAGKFMDLYVQQKCSASNHIISAKDHRSIQMNTAKIDKVTGKFNGVHPLNGQFETFAICGAICRMGESDDSIL
ncbi:40S ribosomal protein S21-like [Panthera pardus]|uniref:Small ribosomal subunit protein eS21 n=1 Tax=Panthera pardus TaxID=9691 RepID=A0A9W2V7H5_PANPR|nr:40S ribosomal protein S21-like [Panthera tigris]XP_042809989.1 40S ribosomal protein S21-like [Panthera leo]XP_049474775.1 40S ribosomal protein S21-like [Panthera uncia]XP_053754601.1 40S ribosomal protein S21-like [Panthera pardus]